MRGLVIALGIVAVLYAADRISFDGKYSRSLTEITSKALHHFGR
jgi:hypothetical protein